MKLIDEMIAARNQAIADRFNCMLSHEEADFERIGMQAVIDVVERRLLRGCLKRGDTILVFARKEAMVKEIWQAVKDGR